MNSDDPMQKQRQNSIQQEVFIHLYSRPGRTLRCLRSYSQLKISGQISFQMTDAMTEKACFLSV